MRWPQHLDGGSLISPSPPRLGCRQQRYICLQGWTSASIPFLWNEKWQKERLLRKNCASLYKLEEAGSTWAWQQEHRHPSNCNRRQLKSLANRVRATHAEFTEELDNYGQELQAAPYFCDALLACWEEILLLFNVERVDTFGHFSKWHAHRSGDRSFGRV